MKKVYEINGKSIAVEPDETEFNSLPSWNVWEVGKKKSTIKYLRGSSFDAVAEDGTIYQDSRLVAETYEQLTK